MDKSKVARFWPTLYIWFIAYSKQWQDSIATTTTITTLVLQLILILIFV